MAEMSEILQKIENIVNHTRQSAKFRNESEQFVREVLRRAKEAKLHDIIPAEHIEGLAAEGWIKPLVKSKGEYPAPIIEIADQRRNHKLMLKLLRHPDEIMRMHAAEHLQMLFAMLDGYYDEASSLVNQILIQPTEIPAVKYALLRDLGRSSRRGLPREISDTARRLIHDMDQGVSYHALRLLSYMTDLRDWKAVLDRMLSLLGEEDEAANYFLAAGIDYLAPIMQYEPTVVEWAKSLIDSYPADHLAVQALQAWVLREPDLALQVGLINRRQHQEIVGG